MYTDLEITTSKLIYRSLPKAEDTAGLCNLLFCYYKANNFCALPQRDSIHFIILFSTVILLPW